ncbi:MAG: TIGR03905 family TSCPD domain-containing protein [Treponema sp.]|nr:TIGR03905 family TSCPD domain-containing protein [Treponema sp.]
MYHCSMHGTCARKVHFDIVDGKIHNVSFEGGCNGNLKALSLLVENRSAEEVIKILKGVTCGLKKTSCGEQFALAVEQNI